MIKQTTTLLVLAALLAPAAGHAADKGTAIARKHFDLKKPATISSSATMVLTDKGGTAKTRTLQISEKETDNGTCAFMEFTTPANVKGTRFLSISGENDATEQRIYLPALKKARLIASSGKKGKFVGSDFSFYDLEDRSFEDYTFSFLRDEQFDTHPCCVIKMVTKNSDAPYAYAEAWVDTTDWFVYQLKMYDRNSRTHCKTLEVLQTSLYDGCIIPVKVRMSGINDGTKTELSLEDVKVNKGVDEKVFSVRNLEAK
jgi:outer membrane lipoprotein-sorting protein